MYNEININFLSKRSNISIIRNVVSAIVLDYNPTITYLNELKTVVSEAVTNSIVHGYNNQEDNYIDLSVVCDSEKCRIVITDYGIGIPDIAKAKEPLFSTKSEAERSGLGFTIMEMFSDYLYVESTVDKGTKLTIEKKW